MRLALALSLLAVRGWACTCMGSPAGRPPCDSAWRFDAVFTGMVTAVQAGQVTFRIAQALNGVDARQQEIVIRTGFSDADCGYPFARGRDYLVYASKRPDGSLVTGICHPTRPIAEAGEDLAYFRHLPQAQPTSEVRVLAYNVLGPWNPVPALGGVRVTLTGPDVRRQSVTDASGRVTFSGLPPGTYRVEPSMRGYVPNMEIEHAKAPAKGCVIVELALRLDRPVTGTVRYNDGRPAAGVNVEALPKGESYAADAAVTDANGSYAIRQLRSGDYHLGVSISMPPTPRAPHPRWFYPGTGDPAAAALIQLTDTPGAQRYDLTIPDPLRERVIRGILLWPDGRPVVSGNISLEDSRYPNRMAVFANTDADGRFTAQALEATRYRVLATGMRGQTPAFSEPSTVEPGRDPVDLRMILTRATPVRR